VLFLWSSLSSLISEHVPRALIRASGPDVTHNYHHGHPPVTWRQQHAPLFMTGCSSRFEKGCNDRTDSPNADAPQRLLRTLIKHALLRWRVNREDSSPSSLLFVSLRTSPLAHLLHSANLPAISNVRFFMMNWNLASQIFCQLYKCFPINVIRSKYGNLFEARPFIYITIKRSL